MILIKLILQQQQQQHDDDLGIFNHFLVKSSLLDDAIVIISCRQEIAAAVAAVAAALDLNWTMTTTTDIFSYETKQLSFYIARYFIVLWQTGHNKSYSFPAKTDSCCYPDIDC